MDFTGKQLLIFLALEHGVLLYLFIKYGYPMIKRISNQVDENTANQKVLADNDAKISQRVDIAVSACLQARDHCADIKQEIRNQTNVAGLA